MLVHEGSSNAAASVPRAPSGPAMAGPWSPGRSPASPPTAVLAAFAVLGAVLAAYLVVLVRRGPDEYWTWLDGWVICAVELAAAGLCLARSRRGGPTARACLWIGLALLAWALGDVALTIETMGGREPSIPSFADALYLSFYPLAYVGTVLLVRTELSRLSRPNWLDGAVAGLGAAAVCAAFAFEHLQHDLGDNVREVAINLSYPIGDLLLLSFVMGATVFLAHRRALPWLVLAAGIFVNVAGDTFNLVSSSEYATRVGNQVDAIAWPLSVLLVAAAVWLRQPPPDPLHHRRAAGFALPGVASALALAVLVAGTGGHVASVALALATATLVAVGVRLGLSARDLRRVTESRHLQAMTDELTGLPNRRRLFDVLDAYFEEPADLGRPLAFLYIDLDRFKELNDTYGHTVGDEVLHLLGERLAAGVPQDALAARLGGDEFAVVLFGDAASAAANVASSLVERMAAPYVLQRATVSLGASVGIAFSPLDAGDSTSLLWCADVAMYRAKQSRRSVAFYDHGVDGGEDRLRLVEELHDAVRAGAFVTYYQPQLDLRTDEVVGFEALLRWPHERLGQVPPDVFIPLAEEAGLMRELTAWVLDAALSQCSAWRAEGARVTISVNVSTANLVEAGFCDRVGDALRRHGLPATALVLEVTETGVITDVAGATETLGSLRDLGVVVSIDDFGAGVTSLAYLSNLPVGELKLDRGFLAHVGAVGGRRDLELVRATIKLGHDLGLTVVAEGIEDGHTLEVLRGLGCDLAQGYHIGRPLPASEVRVPVPVASVRA